MDDVDAGAQSRAPRVQDLVAICRALVEADARFVLIGGFAVILHGYVRATKDIDLLVDASDENVARIKRALASALPDRAAELIEDDEVRRYTVVRIADEVVVDLLERACGIDYEEAAPEIEWFDLEGTPIPIASIELLLRTKNTPRPSDHADAAFLRRVLEEG